MPELAVSFKVEKPELEKVPATSKFNVPAAAPADCVDSARTLKLAPLKKSTVLSSTLPKVELLITENKPC